MKADKELSEGTKQKLKEYRAGYVAALNDLLAKIDHQKPRAHRLSVQGLADARSMAQAMRDQLSAQPAEEKATAK